MPTSNGVLEESLVFPVRPRRRGISTSCQLVTYEVPRRLRLLGMTTDTFFRALLILVRRSIAPERWRKAFLTQIAPREFPSHDERANLLETNLKMAKCGKKTKLTRLGSVVSIRKDRRGLFGQIFDHAIADWRLAKA